MRQKGGKMQLSDKEMSSMLKEIGQNISQERKRRGISMANLAELANVSVSHISKVENEQCEIGLKALLKIAEALEMDVSEFLPESLKVSEKTQNRQTNGEKFEHIIQGAEPQSVEFVLMMSGYMMKAFQEHFSYKKRKK